MNRRQFVRLAVCSAMFGASPCMAGGKDLPKPGTPVLAIGDSMMKLLGVQLQKVCKAKGITPVDNFASLGSGLARPDAFDWTAKITSLQEQKNAKTYIVILGTNDRQTLKRADGAEVVYGTPEWKTEYSGRIGAIMDHILKVGAEHIIWLLQPDMKLHVEQEYAQLVNEIVTAEAGKPERRDKVYLFDMRPLLTKTPGKFSLFVMAPNGAPLTVRETDGVHLTQIGARRVAESIVKTYWGK